MEPIRKLNDSSRLSNTNLAIGLTITILMLLGACISIYYGLSSKDQGSLYALIEIIGGISIILFVCISLILQIKKDLRFEDDIV